MRKVLVCDQLTPEVEAEAEQLGIPEIAAGIPRIMAGALKDVPLPAVVVESASNPYAFLLAVSMGNTSKEQLNALEDMVPVITPTLADKVADLEARLAALEGTKEDV